MQHILNRMILMNKSKHHKRTHTTNTFLRMYDSDDNKDKVK